LPACPPATKRLSFVKLSCISIAHGQEPDVVRPRQRKTGGGGDHTIAIVRLSRQCLDFPEAGDRFSGRRLENVAISDVEQYAGPTAVSRLS
jgi:hypothetical protein